MMEDASLITIGMAEDQLLFRKGMKAVLAAHPGFDVVFEADDGEQLLSALRGGCIPDVLLLDLRMPGLDGLEATRIIKQEFPDLGILILSAYDEQRFIAHMVELGVNGYLDKNSDPEEVIKAIETIDRTGFYFNQEAIDAMRKGLGEHRKKISLHDPAGLTTRELEVLHLICQEKTAGEIGEKLFLSARTVEGHRNNLLLKTGSRNIAGLVMYAVKNGLLVT